MGLLEDWLSSLLRLLRGFIFLGILKPLHGLPTGSWLFGMKILKVLAGPLLSQKAFALLFIQNDLRGVMVLQE
jgi:hypothetical protein